MKKVLLLVVAAMFTVGTLSAQDRPQQREMDPKAIVEKLTESLSLTDEQAEKITAIYTEAAEARQGEQGGERPSQEEMQKAQEEMTKKVMAVLTEEQQEAYTELMKKQQQERGGREGGREGGGGRQ